MSEMAMLRQFTQGTFDKVTPGGRVALQIKIREDAQPLVVEDDNQLDEALRNTVHATERDTRRWRLVRSLQQEVLQFPTKNIFVALQG